MPEGWGASRPHIFLFHRFPYNKKLQLGLTEKSVRNKGLEQDAMAELDFGVFSLRKWVYSICVKKNEEYLVTLRAVHGRYWVATE